MAAPTDPFTAALAREAQEQKIDDLAEKFRALINGSSVDLAAQAFIRATRTRASGEQAVKLVKPAKLDKKKPAATTEAEAGNKTGMILAALRARPRMPLIDLAQAVYGGTDRVSQGKVRSLLAALKKAEKATNVEEGEWEVLPGH